MKLITWNIQWGCGVDGRVDLERVVATARAFADFDVLCVQEVADNFPALPGNDERDQFAALAALLPGYRAIAGYGADLAGEAGRRRRFGNAIYSRYEVLSARRHALPWPADAGKETMPRVAVEATLQSSMGALRITTTHLEYYSDVQRRAQARALRELHGEACGRALHPGFPTAEGGPFDATPQTVDAILTADFNFPPEHPAYDEIQQAPDGGGPALPRRVGARARPPAPRAHVLRAFAGVFQNALLLRFRVRERAARRAGAPRRGRLGHHRLGPPAGPHRAGRPLGTPMAGRILSLTEPLFRYVVEHTGPEHPVAAQLRAATAALPQAGMQIGLDEARLLQLLVRLAGARRTHRGGRLHRV